MKNSGAKGLMRVRRAGMW